MYSEQLTIDATTVGFTNWRARPLLMQRPHRHSEVELNLVVSGEMTYIFGGTRVTVTAGQLALFWASTPHQLIAVADTTICHWLTIPFATFLQWLLPEALTQRVIRGQFVLSPASFQAQATQWQFQQWQVDMDKHSSEHYYIVRLEIEAYLRRLAIKLAEQGQDEGKTQTRPPHELSRIEQMACFIAEHYTEPIRVENVAQAAHLHPNYALTLFRKHFGMSLVDYVTQYRLAHAQRLLATTEMNTSAIALEAGFGSVSRFYTTFKEALGKPPAAYRATIRNGLSNKA
ncbi:MAG: helix-turn-helix domain-containing protein [Ktedonobacteraceae bacterium]|nr:helix-turn-helix domain-containing protein [Ktedonobacteraceae bacterium]